MRPKLGNRIMNRIGYGTMRLPGINETPENQLLARHLLRKTASLEINVIDTADFYGGGLANRLIFEALSPYPENLIISTKVGAKAGHDGHPEPAAKPDELKATVERNLEELGISSLDLVFLRLPGGPLPDSGIPLQTSLECLARLQEEGLVKHIGLSSASMDQAKAAKSVISVDAIQNAHFVGHQNAADVIWHCHDEGIPFLAYFPLGMGKLIQKKIDLGSMADTHQASNQQIALAWLLALSPMIVPIPGTSNIEHLKENYAALNLSLSPREVETLSNVA